MFVSVNFIICTCTIIILLLYANLQCMNSCEARLQSRKASNFSKKYCVPGDLIVILVILWQDSKFQSFFS